MLPSQHATRQVPWETKCLDPKEDLLAAFDLMDAAEKTYFTKLKKNAESRAIYETYFQLASYKELVCIFIKTVDDECVAYEAPQLMPPSYWDTVSPPAKPEEGASN